VLSDKVDKKSSVGSSVPHGFKMKFRLLCSLFHSSFIREMVSHSIRVVPTVYL